ncbi:MAG TPA: hypothetical protein PKO24_06805 [Methanomassiliicoccales archaeon]|jgi:uncharacterized coiled-coil protein SlyX|nr:hypothetical protein [Methanomassiliicoccales archaeon]MCE5261251.1 hypothetical protein [Euryarchaeota archaeon]HOE53325.1 hypothetical protein [Methanomassiliicoccales archaeon]HOO03982.1 hypothetical protein [Methanomassiliicoccales archaeon]HQM67381.1 hypothetical protein [Methanomassiliicoccales archaeon]
MFPSKRTRLERKIKELNALMAEYRDELEETERRFRRREIGRDELDRITARNKAKMEGITERIRAARAELDGLK